MDDRRAEWRSALRSIRTTDGPGLVPARILNELAVGVDLCLGNREDVASAGAAVDVGLARAVRLEERRLREEGLVDQPPTGQVVPALALERELAPALDHDRIHQCGRRETRDESNLGTIANLVEPRLGAPSRGRRALGDRLGVH